jgi:hypothetical protein
MPGEPVDPVVVPFQQGGERLAIARARRGNELEIWIAADFPHPLPPAMTLSPTGLLQTCPDGIAVWAAMRVASTAYPPYFAGQTSKGHQ